MELLQKQSEYTSKNVPRSSTFQKGSSPDHNCFEPQDPEINYILGWCSTFEVVQDSVFVVQYSIPAY